MEATKRQLGLVTGLMHWSVKLWLSMNEKNDVDWCVMVDGNDGAIWKSTGVEYWY